MAAGNEGSRIQLLFGDEFEGQGQSFVNLKLEFSQQSANEQIEELNQLLGGQVQSSGWKLLIGIEYEQGKLEQMRNLIKQIKNEDQVEQSEEKASGFSEMYKEITEQGYEINFIESQAGNKIFLVVNPQEDILNELKAPFDMFYEQGLQEIAQTQRNTIQVGISTNSTIENIIKSLKEKERLFAALLQSAKAEIRADFSKDFGEKISDFAKNIDDELAQTPALLVLRHFSSLEIDLKFSSTQELPHYIRKHILPGKSENLHNNPTLIEMYEDVLVRTLIENIGQQAEVYFTIPDFMAFRAQVFTPQLSQFFTTFGKNIANEEEQDEEAKID